MIMNDRRFETEVTQGEGADAPVRNIVRNILNLRMMGHEAPSQLQPRTIRQIARGGISRVIHRQTIDLVECRWYSARERHKIHKISRRFSRLVGLLMGFHNGRGHIFRLEIRRLQLASFSRYFASLELRHNVLNISRVCGSVARVENATGNH